MASFCHQFGSRNPTTSPVRTRFEKSPNGKRLELTFLFSNEVIQITGWSQGDLLDVSCEGQVLVIEPSKAGRRLHGKPPFVEVSFEKSQLEQVKQFFGFDVQLKHYWDSYNIDGYRLLLQVSEIDKPA